MTRASAWGRAAGLRLSACVLVAASAVVGPSGTATPAASTAAAAPTGTAMPATSTTAPTPTAALQVAAAQAPTNPGCRASRPASRGRLTLNPPRAARGTQVLAVITDLERFPQQVVGAGSGEFFDFCFGAPFDPMSTGLPPVEGPVVIALTVPPDAPLGRRQVEVVFSEGSGGYSAPHEARVWLAADVDVTSSPVPLRARDPSAPPCDMSAPPAPSGSLDVTPARTSGGRALRVRLEDPPRGMLAPASTGGFYVVCLLGNALVSPRVHVDGVDAPTPPLDLSVTVPAGAPPGRHELRVLGLLPGPDFVVRWVGWSRPVTVVGPAPRVPVGGVDAGGGAAVAPVVEVSATLPGREGQPVGIEVPALGLSAPVHPVGVDAAGRLGVPADVREVGWWADSPLLPGTPTVLVGHVDGRAGPGVFADLHRLRVGQPVTVVRGDGTRTPYTVTGLRQVAKTAFPTEDVYGPRERPTLQLVTCTGAFDRRSRHYRDNLVVTAVQDGAGDQDGIPDLPDAGPPEPR